MNRLLFVLLLISWSCNAADTLFTHPFYPPLVYTVSEYNFYKYTPRYVPEDMLQCFKILGTNERKILERFEQRMPDEVITRGIFDRGYRLRKEFCLEGYSSFTHYFHRQGIYFPHAMQTYILLCFHQYLKGERIHWHQNKTDALKNLHRENNIWKKRTRNLFKPQKMAVEIIETEPTPAEEDLFFKW